MSCPYHKMHVPLALRPSLPSVGLCLISPGEEEFRGGGLGHARSWFLKPPLNGA